MQAKRTRRRLLSAGFGVAALTAAPGLACGNPVAPGYENASAEIDGVRVGVGDGVSDDDCDHDSVGGGDGLCERDCVAAGNGLGRTAEVTALSRGVLHPEAVLETFELEMLGGQSERRYRKLRPEVEALPWGTLETALHKTCDLAEARGHWTVAAFQEQRTGAACAETIRSLLGCRAPIDLVGLASAFPLDEVVHVEMCARIAEELGGGTTIHYDPCQLAPVPDRDEPPLLQAAEMIVAAFCVGEAFSVPVLHGTWRAAKHPLLRGVLGIIVKDEAPHGAFGWTFLDWASEALAPHRERLALIARLAIEEFTANHRSIARLPETDLGADLGWMEPTPYLKLSRRAMAEQVIAPLRKRGIDPYAPAIEEQVRACEGTPEPD